LNVWPNIPESQGNLWHVIYGNLWQVIYGTTWMVYYLEIHQVFLLRGEKKVARDLE